MKLKKDSDLILKKEENKQVEFDSKKEDINKKEKTKKIKKSSKSLISKIKSLTTKKSK